MGLNNLPFQSQKFDFRIFRIKLYAVKYSKREIDREIHTCSKDIFVCIVSVRQGLDQLGGVALDIVKECDHGHTVLQQRRQLIGSRNLRTTVFFIVNFVLVLLHFISMFLFRV